MCIEQMFCCWLIRLCKYYNMGFYIPISLVIYKQIWILNLEQLSSTIYSFDKQSCFQDSKHDPLSFNKAYPLEVTNYEFIGITT